MADYKRDTENEVGINSCHVTTLQGCWVCIGLPQFRGSVVEHGGVQRSGLDGQISRHYTYCCWCFVDYLRHS